MREPKRTPCALESVADEPKEPERHRDKKEMLRLRNKDVGHQPPDLARTYARHIERKIGIESRLIS